MMRQNHKEKIFDFGFRFGTLATKRMPIEVQTQVKVFDQEQFHALASQILMQAFAVQNDFGRFLNEELAKREIASRCAEIGILPVEREVRVRVSYEGFAKDYAMDLLFASGLMCEVKTVEIATPVHRAQALNYLLLCGMNHGLLLNLRTEKVEHEFISTRLTPERRKRFSVVENRWNQVNAESAFFKQKTIELLKDWGVFLDVNLYREALVFFLGGASEVLKPVEIFSGNRCVGTQDFKLLTPEVAFAVSTIVENPEGFGLNLQRFLDHTRLRHLQWVNLNHDKVEF